MKKLWRVFGAWVLCLFPFVSAYAEPAGEAIAPTYVPPDCGTKALYFLLQLSHRPTPLTSLEAVLPPPSPSGYSMADLARASRRVGLPLRGRTITLEDTPLDRSVIAYMSDGRSGHFLVVRPVGVTGTMAQVYDPPLPPIIADYKNLFQSPAWTGHVLVPVTTFERMVPALWFTALMGLGLILLIPFLKYGMRQVHAARPPKPSPTNPRLAVGGAHPTKIRSTRGPT